VSVFERNIKNQRLKSKIEEALRASYLTDYYHWKMGILGEKCVGFEDF
jgi:hypothetical protein